MINNNNKLIYFQTFLEYILCMFYIYDIKDIFPEKGSEYPLLYNNNDAHVCS